jgi:hypothetical protein
MVGSIAPLPIANLPIATLPIAGGGTVAQQPFLFPDPGTLSFTPPVSGYWKFVGWGGGGNGTSGTIAGGSGAYVEITKFLTTSSVVTIVTGTYRGDTTFTFSDGTVATAGGAPGGAGAAGIASGGDINLNGSAGVSGAGTGNAGLGTGGGPGGASGTRGGSGSPANLPYRGCTGGGLFVGTGTPDTTSLNGGPGLALATFIRS